MGSAANHSRTGRTALFLTIVVLTNSFGNMLLAMGMERMPDFAQVGLQAYIAGLLHSPFVLPGVVLSATSMLTQLSLFSWADLSFVIPCTASSYVISMILAEFILGEQVHLVRWVGVALIFVGVVLVARTPVATKPHADAHVVPEASA
jgi:uncharacterized membrane protein